MVEVVLENVTKVYPGGVEAVKRMNLHVRGKEFVVLVGPSGCGKSTTLRMIAGLEDITEGTIRIGDRVVNDVPPKDRDIAMVFQNYALYPHMTVYKNMAFSLKLRRYPKKEIDQRVHEAARILGIEELLDRRPKALSGGQRQRVAVGRAIVRHPKASLFDEPLSNLDAKLRVEMRAELKRLHRRLETTTIYVTHDQEEAMTLGDRIVVMRDGVVHQVGPPLEVYDRPANRFVAGFVGTPPMNFLEGRLVAEGGAVYFDEGTARIRLTAHQADALGAWIGKDVVMGVRPEGMAVDGADEENVLPVAVGVVEPLGEKIDLYVSTDRHPHVVARVQARRGLSAGQNIRLHLNMEKVRLFEPGKDGVNLLESPA
ncbi:MAG TPA: sn-glycerol-3-phosphate ABC transporter ATP-binding protein UgpC [Phycisphaerae bacterium]|nr:sn-glycerol-3-phosphate ABC transporter ATP-binding protein UgpC [Phycisphaerae bacterium]HUT62000.1 sn-glycerol-3-phosphate ABC transporter ATP-binding protein UgpC [Phycisphaerae bacterium]